LQKGKVRCMANQTNSLAHTKWMCKYHIVFTPKYRRKAIYKQVKADIRDIIRMLCKYKGVEIIEGHMMPDHVHLLLSIPPKMSVSSFMGYLKGKSALQIFDRHANLKYKYGNRHFWAEGYYVSTVGLNEATIGGSFGILRSLIKEAAGYGDDVLRKINKIILLHGDSPFSASADNMQCGCGSGFFRFFPECVPIQTQEPGFDVGVGTGLDLGKCPHPVKLFQHRTVFALLCGDVVLHVLVGQVAVTLLAVLFRDFVLYNREAGVFAAYVLQFGVFGSVQGACGLQESLGDDDLLVHEINFIASVLLHRGVPSFHMVV